MPIPSIDRRDFLLGAASSVIAAPAVLGAARPQVAVVGGGAGGATAARLIRRLSGGAADVTLLTGYDTLYDPPFLLTARMLGLPHAGQVDQKAALEQASVTVTAGLATALDPARRTLTFTAGSGEQTLSYDILLAAPGVAFKPYGQDKDNATGAACWSDSAECADHTNRLKALPEGAKVVFTAPAQPYSCPPAVYERACLAAHLFKQTNAKVRILIVDDKDEYPMQTLFETAYADHYGGMIEWIPRDFHGGIVAIDAAAGTVETATETIRGDLVLPVPPQAAQAFLADAGFAGERGYCPIEAATMRAAADNHVYIAGDSASASEISKSAESAVVQAKLAARSIVSRLTGRPVSLDVDIKDRCWVFLAPGDAIMLGGSYKADGENFVPVERFASSPDDTLETRRRNAARARAWPQEILAQIFGEEL